MIDLPRQLRVLPLFVSCALAACGTGQSFLSGDLCGQAASANEAVGNKLAACYTADTGFAGGQFTPCFDPAACEQAVGSCNAQDRSAMQGIVDCQNAYANDSDCSFAAIATYNSTCASLATTEVDGGSALSAACVAAFSNGQGICSGDAGD